jgi:DNA repair protein RadC
MYQPLFTNSASVKPPTRPAWLRLVREPLRAAERDALAARHGTVKGSADVAELLRDRALAEEVECFYVVALDAHLHPFAIEEVARGSLASVAITPREILRLAVVLGAFAIILAHNHPSGDPLPSREDLQLTRRVVASSEVLGIHVLAHVVLAGGPAVRADWFFGFRDHGLLADP